MLFACDQLNNLVYDVESLTLDREEVTLYLGDSCQLVLTVTPAEAANFAKISWVSLNEQIATVQDGLVKAVGPGDTEVRALFGDVKAALQVFRLGKLSLMTIPACNTKSLG